MRLRVATYNIHRCIGRDGLEEPDRIAGVLRRIRGDVIALQEAAYASTGPVNILEDLARSTGTEAIAGPTLLEEKGQYGNALLTRIKPVGVRRLNISVPGREPRGALAMELSIGGRRVRMVATHLGLRPVERRYQVRRLLTLLDPAAADVTIVLGDFNEWYLWARPLRWLARRLGALPALPTFPSHRPLLALDRIWVHPPESVLRLRLHFSRTAAVASDHLPLVADIRI
jgi:endonuclease/exonuclease/phosphatase family metal-dependent hydrolase